MEDPEILSYKLNFYKPLLDKAITITERYVSKHKLILTGGMAIDLALRAKGKSIYDDDQLPDYDIISDENLMHAHSLAKELCDAGLPNINVINAVHVTTVRVRMKRDVLLDATYVPSSCYSKIPYLDVSDLRVVHPHYQFIDQRLSLSQLVADTGKSLNVFNRLKKDITRNLLLRSEYPVDTKPQKWKHRSVKIPLDLIRIDTSKLNEIDKDAFVYTGKTCIAGFLGYAIMMQQHDSSLQHISIDSEYLTVNVPTDLPIRFLTVNMNEAKAFMNKPKMYRPLINIKPVCLKEGDFELVDTYGLRIGCNIIKLSDKLSVCVASVDYLLMEHLRDRIYIDKEPYSSMYLTLSNVVDQMREVDSHLMWWPSLDCYGMHNLPEYRVLMLERLMDPDTAGKLKPRNEYLQKSKECKVRPNNFDSADSHYFMIDGEQDDKLNHTNYKYVVDAFNAFIKNKK